MGVRSMRTGGCVGRGGGQIYVILVRTYKLNDPIDASKQYEITNCLNFAERLFQYFTPLNEKDFWPSGVLNSGNFKSVEVFRKVWKDLYQFLEYSSVKY